MNSNDELKVLEDELSSINNSVSKSQRLLETVIQTETILAQMHTLLMEVKKDAQDAYNTKFKLLQEHLNRLKNLASEINYTELTDFQQEEIIPQGAISYNFQNINYDSLILEVPQIPPISQEELKQFLLNIETRISNVLLQKSQLKSFKSKIERIIEKLSVAAIASYLCS